MSTKEELRNLALSYVSEVFRQKLDSVADSCAAKDQAPGDEDITEDVKVKFEQTFANYLSTGFDVVFKKDLQEVESNEAEGEKHEQEQDLSVNDEQLQEMDNAINATCNRRKFVPAQCSLFLDKTLKLQVDAAKRIKTKVRSVEPLTVPPQVQLSNSEDSDSQLREEVKDLMSLARTRDHKALKVEKTLKMLIDVQQENSEAASASEKQDDN